jgi:hypothetical protein
MLQGLSAIPAVFAALILRTDRRLVASLRDAGAVTAATATPLEPQHALARWRLTRLQRVGAIGRNSTGDVFLDATAWEGYRRRRRRRVLFTVAVVVPLAVAIAFAFGGT